MSAQARGRAGKAEAPPRASAVPAANAWAGFRIPAWLAVAIVLVACVWLYLPALDTQFFADDYLFLDQVRSRPLAAAIAAPDPLSNFFRPISRQVWFWTIASATHESPRAFHVANLASYLVLLVLLFLVARRLAGARAATIAVAFMALHYTADVPVRWACGSQELLSVTGALAAILFHLQGRRPLAAVAMVLAALSKEVVLLTPLIAAAADKRAGESWLVALRRTWPLWVGFVVWGAIWLLMPHRRAAQGTEVELNPWGPLAVLVHLVRVTIGLEWRQGELGHLPKVGPPWLALALVLAAVTLCCGRLGRERDKPARAPAPRHAIVTGSIWALLATAPVIAVAILWSAYYFLYAMCGVSLVLGALLARRPRWVAAAVIAVLAWGSASARSLDEFGVARDPWTSASHINAHYIDRANKIAARYLEDMRRQRPKFPPRSTILFAGLKGNVAFQAADGPLVRWAYRDSSLKAYYLNQFNSNLVRRGPLYVFIGRRDSLKEMPQGPDLLAGIAFGMIVSDQRKSARDALVLEHERDPASTPGNYWLAWMEWTMGDRTAAEQALRRGGYEPAPGPSPETATALAQVGAGDTLGAIETMRGAVRKRALDAGAHGLLADLLLARDSRDADGAIEAFATRALAMQDPYTWRRWAMVQTQRERYLEALASFDRYVALGGVSARQDGEVEKWVASIRAMLPGGDLEQVELRQ